MIAKNQKLLRDYLSKLSLIRSLRRRAELTGQEEYGGLPRDRSFSTTSGVSKHVMKGLRSTAEVGLLHMIMILHPVPGMEYTRGKNIIDMADSLLRVMRKLQKTNKRLGDVYLQLEEGDVKAVVKELRKDHQYSVVKIPLEYCNLIMRHIVEEFDKYVDMKVLPARDVIIDAIEKKVVGDIRREADKYGYLSQVRAFSSLSPTVEQYIKSLQYSLLSKRRQHAD